MKILSNLFPTEDQKAIKRIKKTVDAVFALEEDLKTISDPDLKAKSIALRDEIRAHIEMSTNAVNTKEKNKSIVEGILNEKAAIAFALVRESARRTLAMMHYRVQVVGGLLIHHGHIAEMRTGEGKDRKSVV